MESKSPGTSVSSVPDRPVLSPGTGLVSCVLALSAFGLIMLFSTSYFWAAQREGISYAFHLFRNQVIYVLSALILLILISQTPLRWIERCTWVAYAGTLLLLSLVFVPGVGVEFHGSHRWIHLAGFGLQPSEIAKLAVVLSVAYYASRDSEHIRTFKQGFLPVSCIIAIPAVLVLLEPDLGTGVFLIGLGFMVAVVGGLRLLHLIPSVLAVIPAMMGLFWYRFEHFRERITVFLNPGSDPLGTGHQIRQSLIAIGSGGKYGTGLGLSRQKLFFLPQPNTDFIFSIIGEETGFAGCLFVILMYMGIVWFGCEIARRARNRFGKAVATGITLCISIQAVLNIAIATALFPTKGLPLPLLSKGGSSIFMTMIMVGVLLAVHNHSTGKPGIEGDVTQEAN